MVQVVLVALVVPKIQVFRIDQEILVHLAVQDYLVGLSKGKFHDVELLFYNKLLISPDIKIY